MALTYEQLMSAAKQRGAELRAQRERDRGYVPKVTPVVKVSPDYGSILKAPMMPTWRPGMLPTGREETAVAAPSQPRLAPGALKTEMADRRYSGNYALPGGHEDRIAELEGSQRTQQTEVGELRSYLLTLQQSVNGIGAFNNGANTGRTSHIQSVQARLDEAKRALSQTESAITAEKTAKWQDGQDLERLNYERVRGADDFSAGVTAGKNTKYSGIVLGLPTVEQFAGWPGGKEIARYLTDSEFQAATDGRAANALGADKKRNLQFLNQDERDTMLYYAGRGDFDQVEAYYRQLTRNLDRRRQEEESARTVAMSEQHPLLGGVYNTAASFFSPAAYLENAGQAAKNTVTGEYEPTNTNSQLFGPAHAVDDTAQGVSAAGTRMPLLGGLELGGKNIGSFVAETGLSMGQFLTKAPLGPLALPYMGADAAGQTTLDALERGGTPGQALALGTAAGVIETVTEKVSLDRLLKVAEGSGKMGVRQMLLSVLGQAGVEASEETVAEVANNLADISIMGQQSGLERYVGQLMQEQGMTRAQAESIAIKQFFLVNTAWAAAGGALSGGAMGGGAVAINSAQNAADYRAIDRAYGAMQEHGLFSLEAMEAAANADTRLGIQTGPRPLLTFQQAEAQKNAVPTWGTAETQTQQPNKADGKEIVEKVRKSIPRLEAESRVSKLTGQEFPKGRVNLTEQVGAFFRQLGNKVTRKGLGDVILDERGIKSDIAHGIGRAKSITFAAVPDVIKHGVQIDFVPNWKGRGYSSYVFAAPVDIDGKRTYVGAVVLKDAQNRFYLHEVVDGDGNLIFIKDGASETIKTGVTAQSGVTGGSEAPSIPSIAQGQTRGKSQFAQNSGDKYWGTPATNKLGIKVAHPITDLGAALSLRGTESARYQAERELARAAKQTGATKQEMDFAKDVAEGKYPMEHIHPGMNQEVVQELVDAIHLRDSFDKNTIAARKSRVFAEFDGWTGDAVKLFEGKKAPSVLSLNLNTMQRNMERILGPDAQVVVDELLAPVQTNEAERLRFVNRMLQQIGKYKLNLKESGQVQRLIEGEVTESNLKADGYDAERLSKAAKELSGLYTDFYEAVNDILVSHGYQAIGFQKNYAPHMQEGNMDTLHKYLDRLGFPTEVSELPADIAGRTEAFRPGKQYDPYFQHRQGNKKINDAVGGFESYVNYMSNVVYHIDDIQKLRRFNEALRTAYAPAELRAEIDRLNMLEDRMAEDESFDGVNLQAEKDKAYERLRNTSTFGGLVSVLDDYTNTLAGKQAKVDRSLESLLGRYNLNLGKKLQDAFSKAVILGNISTAVNQTVQIPQLITEVGKRNTVRAVLDVVRGKTARADFAQESDFVTGKRGVQSIAPSEGWDHVKETAYNWAARPFEIVDDFASRVIVRAKYVEQIGKGKSHTDALKVADQYAARLVGSRMKGARPILFEQKNIVSRLVSTFQLEVLNGWEHIKHDLPMEIQEIAKTQGKPAAAKRVAGLMTSAFAVNFLANCIIKGITGREPVPFDALGMLANYMATGYGMTKEEYLRALADNGAESVTGGRPLGTERPGGGFAVSKALTQTGGDIVDSLPLVSNVTSILGLTDGRLPLPQLGNHMLKKGSEDFLTSLGHGEETEDERAAAAARWLPELGAGAVDMLATWVPMGGQAKKTGQGLGALLRGGDYSGVGDQEVLRYNVEQSPANWGRGLLFGKSALPETGRFYAEGGRPLSTGQTAAYQELKGTGMRGAAAYDSIVGLRGVKKTETTSQQMEQIEALRALEATDAQKKVLYRGIITDSRDESVAEAEKAGISFDDYLAANAEYLRINAGGEKTTQKATEFARWMNGQGFSQKQFEALRESFRFFSQVPNEGTDYEDMVAAGVPDDVAYSMSGSLGELKPLKGKESVSQVQKGVAIAESGASAAYQMKALSAVLEESLYEKLEKAVDAEIDIEDFLAAYQAQLGVTGDKGWNGKTEQLSAARKKKTAIDEATPGMSFQDRRVLYELLGVSEQVWWYGGG